MSIESQIQRLKSNVAATYSALADAGAEIPETQSSDNLVKTVKTVPEKMNKVNPTGSGDMSFDGNAYFTGNVYSGGASVAAGARKLVAETTDEEALELLAECGVITPVAASDGTLYTLNGKIVTI